MKFAQTVRTQLLRADSSGSSRAARGFTLVELMVAVTGGLFVSVVVFALAREGSKFYQRESRVAEATLGNVVAFDRLSLDLSRAGFMSSPNLRRDPRYCGDSTTIASLPKELKDLASVRIEEDATAANNAVLKAANRKPQAITLSGSYDTVDRYEAWHIDLAASGSGYIIRLQTNIGALLRLGYASLSATAQAAELARLFPTGRGLRLFNVDTGTFQVSTITGTQVASGESYVLLSGVPTLDLTGKRCGLRGTFLVNLINFVRYRLDTAKNNTAYPSYQLLFATGSQPYEDNRMEFVREELDTSGAVITGTQEILGEYAVDLQFGLTYVNNPTTAPQMAAAGFDVPQTVVELAAKTDAANSRPQDIRAIRARLSLRSREVDRSADVQAATNVAPGLYRIGLTDATTNTSGYARVRTLQADTIVASHMELRW